METIKLKIKQIFLALKEIIQKRSIIPTYSKTFFVSPTPIYLDQFSQASNKTIEKSYGKINNAVAAKKFGAKNIKEFSYWAWRSCGIISLQMILKGLRLTNKDTMTLINEALETDGYEFSKDLGWKHKAIAKLAKKYQLNAKTIRFATIYDIIQNIKKNRYVIASLISPTGGHLCIFFGYKINNKGKITYYYHDPNNYQHAGKKISISNQKMSQVFKNKIIIIWKTK